MSDLLRRGSVFETAAWDISGAVRHLRQSNPGLTIFVTARAYHRRLAEVAPTNVLDYVDALSRAYMDRAKIVSTLPRSAGFRLLAWSHRGFERGTRHSRMRRVAAGWQDAEDLDAEWLPIPVATMDRVSGHNADHDLLFFGTLSYPPNVAAVRRLGSLWAGLTERRPEATLLIAGTRPTNEVRAIATARGWDLVADFVDVRALCARARLAVVPLDHAAGIQIKVLEAAAAGLAQVVSPAALRGLAPGFPAAVAASDAEIVETVIRLLDDDGARGHLAEASWQHVRELYSAERWIPMAADLLTSEPDRS